MFGTTLQNAFRITSSTPYDEIALFRAFIQTFNALGSNVLT